VWKGFEQGLGYGQTWGDYFTSRQRNITYVNDTPKPIAAYITTINDESNRLFCYVNGVQIAWIYTTSAGNNTAQCNLIVPPGATYAVISTRVLMSWVELR
jgi:hypothetical protein